jgi:hypothetical protein
MTMHGISISMAAVPTARAACAAYDRNYDRVHCLATSIGYMRMHPGSHVEDNMNMILFRSNWNFDLRSVHRDRGVVAQNADPVFDFDVKAGQ